MRQFTREKTKARKIQVRTIREEIQDQLLNAVEDVVEKYGRCKTLGDLGMLLEPVEITDSNGKVKGTTPALLETNREYIYDPDNDEEVLTNLREVLEKERNRVHKLFGVS